MQPRPSLCQQQIRMVAVEEDLGRRQPVQEGDGGGDLVNENYIVLPFPPAQHASCCCIGLQSVSSMQCIGLAHLMDTQAM